MDKDRKIERENRGETGRNIERERERDTLGVWGLERDLCLMM